jgi:hypothetical protein
MYFRLCRIALVLVSVHILASCASSGGADFFKVETQKDYSNMYLRGVFNWWEVNESFKLLLVTDELYAVTIELIADGQPYDFKVADNIWSMTLNCGNEFGASPMELNEKRDLICVSDSLNLQFTPTQTSLYRFVLDVSSNKQPELVIQKVD